MTKWVCKKCGEGDPTKRSGSTRSWCRRCWADYMHDYYTRQNPQERWSYRAWRDPEKRKRIQESKRRTAAKPGYAEAHRNYNNQWRATHLHRARQVAHRRWLRNREEIVAQARAWRLKNLEHARQWSRDYYKKNRERVLNNHATRFHRMRANGKTNHTPEQWTALVQRQGGRCYYCGSAAKLVREHKISLSRGGSNNIRNIVGACPLCNARKHTKTSSEFLKMLGRAA